jgi:hypothetical protein
MAITKAAGPLGGSTAINNSVSFLLATGPKSLSPTGGATSLKASQPVRLFMLQANDIVDSNFLEHAKPIGWRYLIVNDGPIAVADVRDGAGGSQEASFGSLIRGRVAERMNSAAQVAEQKYESTQETFEQRILEIPSLYISALWLHGPRDIFIPFLEGAEKDGAVVQEDPMFESRVLSLAQTKRQNLQQYRTP